MACADLKSLQNNEILNKNPRSRSLFPPELMSPPNANGHISPLEEPLAAIRTKVPRTHLYDTQNFDVEASRVQSLHECKIAYIAPEKRFDAIAGLAKQLFKVPVALIGIMDGDEIYFKHGWSCLGPSIDREASFPSYVAVPTHAASVTVSDTTKDARFAAHPAVTRTTNGLRFWSGCPLLGQDGYRYGSLCMFDFVPRQFPATWLNIITNLAELTSRELERDRDLQTGVVPAASEPVIMIRVQDGTWDLLYGNEAFEKLSGVEGAVCAGASLWDHFELDEDNCSLEDVVERVKTGGKGSLNLISKAKPDEESFRVDFCLAGTYRLNNSRVVGISSFVPADEASIAREQNNDMSSCNAAFMDQSLWMGVVMAKTKKQRRTQSPISVLAARMGRSNSSTVCTEEPFLLPAVPAQLLGVTLGPLLGEGSYGKVFRGRDELGAEVAVKVLEVPSYNIGYSTDSRTEQIIAEAMISKHLSHPYIVETLNYVMVDCGQLCHQMWIVQHLCSKGSLYDGIESGRLRERLSLDAPPSMPLVYQTALEIATALQYLHSQGVLHGDLSGNNVLLTSADNERRWKAVVCDFGLATWAASSEEGHGGEEHCSTRPMGTISHTAPEILNGEPMTKAADVYSFGVLLWEMFCGQRAWAGRHSAQILFWVGTLGHGLKLPEEAPVELKDLAAACMAPDLVDRPSFQDIEQSLMNQLTTLNTVL